MMLTGGFVPVLTDCEIVKIKLQGKVEGYNTDDFIVFAKNKEGENRKLLGQIKRNVQVTTRNSAFVEMLQNAWLDYSNQTLFSERDALALVASSLTQVDHESVPVLLEQVRSTNNYDEFWTRINQSGFCSQNVLQKWEVFQKVLHENHPTITEEQIYDFLRHFFILGYDLEKEYGVVQSLLNSYIAQYTCENSFVWGRICNFVCSCNGAAGTISKKNIPREIKDLFNGTKSLHSIPNDLLESIQNLHSWLSSAHVSDLFFANLLGKWDENNENDKAFVAELVDQKYDLWIQKIHAFLNIPESPISYCCGLWEVCDRKNLWMILGKDVRDSHVKSLKDRIVSVLTASNGYSQTLCIGLAETAALLGAHSEVLTSCSSNTAQDAACQIVHSLLDDADCRRWKQLGPVLSLLAEVNPREFLDCTEKALKFSNTSCDVPSEQEECGTFPMVYLLWALELLAWDETNLMRVCILLGRLAEQIPGGTHVNQPFNTLNSILLPWFPQTLANTDKCICVVKNLIKQTPNAAWELLLSFLPGKTPSTSLHRRRSFRLEIPEQVKVSPVVYHQLYSVYTDLMVSFAKVDSSKMPELIENLELFSLQSFENVLNALSSETFCNYSDDEKKKIWKSLIFEIRKNKKYPDSKWALSAECIQQLSTLAEKFVPANLEDRFQYLFVNNQMSLMETCSNCSQCYENLKIQQQEAVQTILDASGLNGILTFADCVEKPWLVGAHLGEKYDYDRELLPEKLMTEDKNLRIFLDSYICSRFRDKKWEWYDSLKPATWEKEKRCRFLLALPSFTETWEKVEDLPAEQQKEYWMKQCSYQLHDDNVLFAVKKMLEFGNIQGAVSKLSSLIYNKKEVPISLCVGTLMSESDIQLCGDDELALISYLQKKPEIDAETMQEIEWKYLPPISNRFYTPLYLERELAEDPEFFCKIIRDGYKSNNVKTRRFTEEIRRRARNAWDLFGMWQRVPGTDAGGVFHPDKFQSWILTVQTSTRNSGHFDSAMMEVGKVCIHSPEDPDGFWIHRAIAAELDRDENETMRNGYFNGIRSSIGCYEITLDTPVEKEYAANAEARADAAENAGFLNLCDILRQCAESFRHDAGVSRDLILRRGC